MPQPPYRDRRTWLIAVRDLAEWRVKVYGISATGEDLSEVVIQSALEHAARHVPDNAAATSPYGFLVLHAGTEAVWLLVDLWFDDILHHFLFRAPLGTPTRWAPGPADGTAACVWELEVVKHERDAWVRHVLSRPEEPDFASYLGDALDIVGS